MYIIITLSILAFLTIFIWFFSKIYLDIKKKNSSTKNAYGILIGLLMFFAWIIITVIYIDLSIYKKVSFVDSYTFPINNQKSITIGSGDEDGKHTYLTNRLAVNSHLLLKLDSKNSKDIGTLELLTDKRKAIVNSTLLRNMSESENIIQEQLELSSHNRDESYINKIKVKNGDFIRIGYSNYKIYREDNSVILDNISLNLYSPVNLFYLYTTTTYPDILIGDKQGVETTSIFWLWLITSIIFVLFTYMLFYIVTKITNYAKGDNWAIAYPILYFTIILEFLFLASYINFTVMYFYQFNVYEKGSLFTEIVVFGMMTVFVMVVYLLYQAKDTLKASKIAMGIYFVILLLFVFIFKDNIYSSTYIASIPKSTGVFLGEQLFIFALFMLFANFLKNGEEYIFIESSREHINNDIYKHIIFASIFLLVTIFVLSAVGLIKEGQGMVFIESTKLFIFLLVTLLFHHSFGKNRAVYLTSLSLFFIVLLGTIFAIKDKGSVLQVALALTIIFVLFKDNFAIKKRWFFTAIGVVIVLFVAFYHLELKDNIRYSMWTEPFSQKIEPSTQYFLYRYEQVARGIFLIKNSSFLPSDFINNSFLPLPAIHTDFIFAFFSNVFGGIGVLTLLFALMLLSLSFKKAMELYSGENEIFKFLYGINSVFIAYMLSYYIINMASVLQIIPLTDVPLPFLTYAKGILVLFLMLYLFVVVFNVKYLRHFYRG
ncbi:Rod shape-determining protein RodA [hydrothermal vent metagenome]|uniref:peptidoglycan glycosyltransferase n=1 Tax=hydrothermal vent metagenome TaxID=652676 RepID=A0A1W1CK36_9ZZZZ